VPKEITMSRFGSLPPSSRSRATARQPVPLRIEPLETRDLLSGILLTPTITVSTPDHDRLLVHPASDASHTTIHHTPPADPSGDADHHASKHTTDSDSAPKDGTSADSSSTGKNTKKTTSSDAGQDSTPAAKNTKKTTPASTSNSSTKQQSGTSADGAKPLSADPSAIAAAAENDTLTQTVVAASEPTTNASTASTLAIATAVAAAFPVAAPARITTTAAAAPSDPTVARALSSGVSLTPLDAPTGGLPKAVNAISAVPSLGKSTLLSLSAPLSGGADSDPRSIGASGNPAMVRSMIWEALPITVEGTGVDTPLTPSRQAPWLAELLTPGTVWESGFALPRFVESVEGWKDDLSSLSSLKWMICPAVVLVALEIVRRSGQDAVEVPGVTGPDGLGD
jgi:hypothetical protein